MTSVPPAIGTAAGCSALAAIASASDAGCRNSIRYHAFPGGGASSRVTVPSISPYGRSAA